MDALTDHQVSLSALVYDERLAHRRRNEHGSRTRISSTVIVGRTQARVLVTSPSLRIRPDRWRRGDGHVRTSALQESARRDIANIRQRRARGIAHEQPAATVCADDCSARTGERRAHDRVGERLACGFTGQPRDMSILMIRPRAHPARLRNRPKEGSRRNRAGGRRAPGPLTQTRCRCDSKPDAAACLLLRLGETLGDLAEQRHLLCEGITAGGAHHTEVVDN